MKKALFFTIILFVGVNSWAFTRNLDLTGGWEAEATGVMQITFLNDVGGYGAYGDVEWSVGIGDYSDYYQVVATFEPTPIKVRIYVKYGMGVDDLGISAEIGATEARILLDPARKSNVIGIFIQADAGPGVSGTLTLTEFYVTGACCPPPPPCCCNDLTFECDAIGNGYEAPYPWGASGLYATVVANPAGSGKVLRLVTPVDDGENIVVKFSNIALRWRDVKAIQFKVYAPEGYYKIDFGACVAGDGFGGINYGGDDNTKANFWKELGDVYPSDFPHYAGEGWSTFTVLYEYSDTPGVDNYTSPGLRNADVVDFYLGLHKGDVTVYLDDIQFLDYVPVGLPTITASSVNVYSIEGGLAIEGTEKATIYGIDGSVIATTTGKIDLPKGVYIVKAGNEAVKAIVK